VATRFWSESPPGLAGVDGVWRHAESVDEREHALGIAQRHFVPPDGCSDLILHFEAGRLQRVFFQEPTLSFEIVEIAPGDALFGVRFRVGVGGALLRRRDELEKELARAFAQADSLDAERVSARLVQSASELVEAHGAERPSWLAEVLTWAEHRHGAPSVGELARCAGVSERTLHRGFLDWVGARPKQLLRALRIREAVRRAQGASAPAESAAELGFADQAHLCREMRELWGTTPGRLLASDFFKTDSAPQPTKAP
jgi:AraC-like DNA-binding protein